MGSEKNNNIAILRLTALWGLVESGLGGWMHALNLPLTGIFVGGCAVVIISLISHFSGHNVKQVLQATLLVLLVKFTASPQTPWQAYIAVGFQGLAGALIYRAIPFFAPAAIVFSIVAMLESALQMPIFMTLVYGNSIWVALDKFFNSIVNMFSLSADISFSYWLVTGYVGMYAIWGLLLGIWIPRLPRQIEFRADSISKDLYAITTDNHIVRKRKKKNNRVLFLIFTLLFITATLLAGKNMNAAEYIILRTITILLLIFGIINPLVNFLVKRWLRKSSSKHKESLESVLGLIPELRGLVRPAYSLATTEHKGLRRYPAFLFILIVVTLYPADEPEQDIHTDAANS